MIAAAVSVGILLGVLTVLLGYALAALLDYYS